MMSIEIHLLGWRAKLWFPGFISSRAASRPASSARGARSLLARREPRSWSGSLASLSNSKSVERGEGGARKCSFKQSQWAPLEST